MSLGRALNMQNDGKLTITTTDGSNTWICTNIRIEMKDGAIMGIYYTPPDGEEVSLRLPEQTSMENINVEINQTHRFNMV